MIIHIYAKISRKSWYNADMKKTVTKNRCSWCVGKPLYEQYHDTEWGVPVYDDKVLFEFLVLESAQAGLSWWIILQKREGYRKLFAGFDYKKIAKFTDAKIDTISMNPAIIRHRGKVAATVENAKRFMAIQKEFGSFSNYLWKFVGGKPINSNYATLKQIQSTTSVSDTIAKDLKKRGFKFMGPTIVYAYMQACGLVNDHIIDCFRHKQVLKKNKK